MKITEKQVRSLFPRCIAGAKKVYQAWKAYKAGKITESKMNEIYFFYVK